MGKKLFVTAPIRNVYNNAFVAIVGGSHGPRNAYIHAHYQGATILANAAIKGGLTDLLFYSICFNYRHYLELHLKSLILGTEQLYFILDELGETKGKLESSAQYHLDSTRNIECLFKLFKKRFDLVSIEVFDPEVQKTIVELQNADFDGQAHRYHEGTNKVPNLPKVTRRDLSNMTDRMKEVHDLLFGIDLWLDHHHGIALSIIDDMKNRLFLMQA